MNENQAVTEEVNAVQPTQEKLLPQHEVNSLVGAAKQKGHERGYQQAMQEMQQQQQSNMATAAAAQAQPMVNQAPLVQNPDDIRRIAQEEIARQHHAAMQAYQQQQQQAEGQRVFNELHAKFAEAKAKDPNAVDFQKALQDFQYEPAVLRWANSVDNPADVIKHLQENPGKLGTIVSLKTMPEQTGINAIKQISDSLKQNQAAELSPKAPEPLSQIRPSNVGVGNSDGYQSGHSQFKGQY